MCHIDVKADLGTFSGSPLDRKPSVLLVNFYYNIVTIGDVLPNLP